MKEIDVQILNSSNNNNPEYSNYTDAGADVRANLSNITVKNLICYGDVTIREDENGKKSIYMGPMARVIVPTGICTSIPEGYEVQIRPRSGLAIKRGLSLANAVGTIDCSYKDQWGVPVINFGKGLVVIEDGERICQAVLSKVYHINWVNVNSEEELLGENRGGGFGHTGTK